MRKPTDIILTLREIADDLRDVGDDALDDAADELIALEARLDSYVYAPDVVNVVDAVRAAAKTARENFDAASRDGAPPTVLAFYDGAQSKLNDLVTDMDIG